MIRWERQEDGGWQGFSGELLVATVTKDESAEGSSGFGQSRR